LIKYGEVKKITEEKWLRIYRYPVYNCIRLAEIKLQKQIPSHMIIMGNRNLMSYQVQTITCYGFNQPGHQYIECRHKKTMVNNRIMTDKNTWAHFVTTESVRRGTQRRGNTERERCLTLVWRTRRTIYAQLNERRITNNNNTTTQPHKIMDSSLASEENQYAEGEIDRESDTGMVIDIQRDSTDDLSLNSMEQDSVSKTIQYTRW
jgi:hypothetical protein